MKRVSSNKTIRLFGIAGVLMSGMFLSCTSPLSDVDINSFDVINASISITKYFGSTSGQQVRARVYDKNLASVEIKNGGVAVNGTEMTYDDNTLIQMYTKDNLVLAPNTTYRFVITISNGDKCTSTVATPAAEFGTVTPTTPFSISGGDTIKWTGVAPGTSINIDLKIRSTADTTYHTAYTGLVADSGRFVIPLIPDTNLTGPATFKMWRSNTGTLDSQLRGGSISATYTYQSSLTAIR